MVLSPLLPQDILLNIFKRLQPRHRENRHQIARRNISCDCWRFRYGQPGGYCVQPVTRYRTGRNLRIHFDTGLSQLERETARIIQAVDFTEAAKGDGYAIFRGSFQVIHRRLTMDVQLQGGNSTTSIPAHPIVYVMMKRHPVDQGMALKI
jgi:hypothetical protein